MSLAKKALSTEALADGSFGRRPRSRYRNSAVAATSRAALPERRAGRPRRGLTLLSLVLAFLSVYPLSMLLYGSLHSTPPGMAGDFKL